MKKRSNIKAFTILEVVISMAIMSIIIAMVYVIYSLMSKQLYDYSEQTETLNNYSQLHSLLKRDIHNSNQLINTNEALYLLSNRDSIEYKNYNRNLIRSTSKTIDTLFVQVDVFKVSEEAILLGDKVKRVEVQYDLFGEKFEAVYFKDYGVSDHINNTFFDNGN